MDGTIVVNIALMLITAIGVVVAALQAREARNARDEARQARDEAQEFERRAVTASEVSAGAAQRSATALEKQVELQIAQTPTDPWKVIQHGGGKYELKNVTKLSMYAVDIHDLAGGNDITLFDVNALDEVGAGQSAFFVYSKTMDSAAQITMQVTWGDPLTGERSHWRQTLS
jgi:cell division protein FtsL